MATAIGTLRRRAHVNHIHLNRKALDIFGRTLKQQRIAHAHHQIIKLPSDVLVAAVNRQRINAVAPPQTQRPQRAANHLAPGRNEHLDSIRLNR